MPGFSGSQTQTTNSQPWAPTQQGLKNVIGDATRLYKHGGMSIDPYKGNWVAPQSQATLQGQQALLGMVPGQQDYANQAQSTVAGFMGPQNYDQIKANTIADIMPGINSTFAGSNMTGSSLHEQNLSKGLAAGLGNVELGARQQQMDAAMAMPGMMQYAMAPGMVQGQVGQQQDAYQQALIDANMKRDLMRQTSKMGGLQNYAQLMSGIGGQFGSQSTTDTSKPGWGDILGMVMGNASKAAGMMI
jgi:hypothetical protein